MPELCRANLGVRPGDSMTVAATPTVFVNGWRFAGTMDSSALGDVINAVLRGEAPRR